MAINAISAALMHSQIPWAGPVAAVRLAIRGDELSLSPTMQDLAKADASMLLVGRQNEIVMIDMQVCSQASILPLLRLSKQQMILPFSGAIENIKRHEAKAGL